MSTSAIIEHMANSPYPPSFQGSGWLYAFAVFSMLLISVVGMVTIVVAGKNSSDQKAWSTGRWTHLAFMLAATGATIRCATEAAYKMAWGETSTRILELLLTIKNIRDAMVFIPVLSWMGIYFFRVSGITHTRQSGIRAVLVVAILASISAILAFHKV